MMLMREGIVHTMQASRKNCSGINILLSLIFSSKVEEDNGQVTTINFYYFLLPSLQECQDIHLQNFSMQAFHG